MPRPVVTVAIPAPCPERWAQMTPAADGRHCATCSQVVVDFSGLSDAEVVAYFSRHSGPACGRFAGQQLGRELLGSTPVPPRWRTWLATVATLTGGLLAPLIGRAQQPGGISGTQPHPAATQLSAAQPAATALPTAPAGGILLRGRLLTEQQDAVPFGSLNLQNLQLGALSDEKGYFSIPLTAEQVQRAASDSLVIEALGFYRQTLAVDFRRVDATTRFDQTLRQRELYFLGVVVRDQPTAPPRPTLWQRLWHRRQP